MPKAFPAPRRVDRGTGTCADNAAMESFFALVQNNVFNRQRWQTRGELRLAIGLDRTHLPPSTSSGSPRLTQIEFEAVSKVSYAA